MFIPDLQELGSRPWVQLDPVTLCEVVPHLPRDVPILAVGWIGDVVTSQGEVPDECISILLDAYLSGRLFPDLTLGAHSCEVCPVTLGKRGRYPLRWKERETTLYGQGHHLVRFGKAIYLCPALILHYIVDHHYQPPPVFIEAVVKGRILDEDGVGLAPKGKTSWGRAWWRVQRSVRKLLPRPARHAQHNPNETDGSGHIS